MSENQNGDPVGAVRIYGAGGFGINIASKYNAEREEGYAEAYPVYVDTSHSNIKPNMDPDCVYLLDDVDGSGKVRRENHEEITKVIRPLLQQFRPLDLNIVVFSASGGSGSVFGPLIVSELLSRGLSTVAVVVGSDESAITSKNTLNTLKSLESIAESTKLPVVMYYNHNDRDVKRSDVDTSVRSVISALSILASRDNDEMDSKDIANWLQYNRTTQVRPRLALFAVYRDNESAEATTDPVSVASLFDSPDAAQLNIVPEYHCAGYPKAQIANFTTLHFVITVDGIQTIVKKMNSKINEIDTARNARIDHDSIVNKSDEVSGNGLVL